MDVFFYGLFMDQRLLMRRGLAPTNARLARLRGHRLRLARRANLVEDAEATTWGLVIELPPDDVVALYSEPSVSDYRAVSVRVELENGGKQPATCYLLPADESPRGHDAEYAASLYRLATELRLPADYLAAIREASASNDRP